MLDSVHTLMDKTLKVLAEGQFLVNTYIWSRGRLCHPHGSLAWQCYSSGTHSFTSTPHNHTQIFFRRGLFSLLTCVCVYAQMHVLQRSAEDVKCFCHSPEAGSGTPGMFRTLALTYLLESKPWSSCLQQAL